MKKTYAHQSLDSMVASLVLDSSALISLIASEHANEVAAALSPPFIVSELVLDELFEGFGLGHDHSTHIAGLKERKLLRMEMLDDACAVLYRSLVDGTTLRTLDDGEAATIALAIQLHATAVIDERKARSLCRERFPRLTVVSTAELLLREGVREVLGDRYQEVWTCALVKGRMRVPTPYIDEIVRIVGIETARQCSCLPLRIRQALG